MVGNAPGLIRMGAKGRIRGAKVDAHHVVSIMNDLMASGPLLVGGDEHAHWEMGGGLRVLWRIEFVFLMNAWRLLSPMGSSPQFPSFKGDPRRTSLSVRALPIV